MIRRRTPLTWRNEPLKASDDRVWLWLLIQFTLIAWGLGLLAEPHFPSLFTRPFAVAAMAPFNALPAWGLAVVMLGGGLAVAASCWLPLTDGARMLLRMVGMALVVTLFVSYWAAGFPYATLQFGALVGVVIASYLWVPTEC